MTTLHNTPPLALTIRGLLQHAPENWRAHMAAAADQVEENARMRTALLRIRNQCDAAQRAYDDHELRPKFCELRDRIDADLAAPGSRADMQARADALRATVANQLRAIDAALRDGDISGKAGLMPEHGWDRVALSRGYAHLGIGAYIINHSAAGTPAELCITLASDEDRATRTVGDNADNPPDAAPIPADEMVVRLRFASVAGLDALEAQLAWVRSVHFANAPSTSERRREVAYNAIADQRPEWSTGEEK